jgi:hypothetical protein
LISTAVDSSIEQADGELCGPFRILVAFGENHSNLPKTFQFIDFEESRSLNLEAYGALCGFLLIHRQSASCGRSREDGKNSNERSTDI